MKSAINSPIKPVTQRVGKALTSLVAASLLFATTATSAQTSWTPTKPIRVVVPFAPGGAGDVLTRLVAAGMQQRNITMVVENKTGATGAIANDYVYGASADGYVLLTGLADTTSIYPHLAKTKSDVTKFIPVAAYAKTAFVLMGRQDLPAANLKELLELAKKKDLTYSTAGAGSSLHAVAAVFASTAKLNNLVHVPYPGAGPALQALVAGHVDLAMVPLGIAGPFRSRLKAYGVTTQNRVDFMKDVPTLTEQGLPVVGESWMGLLAPPNTPPAIVNYLSTAVREIVSSPDFKAKVGELGMTPLHFTQPEFANYYSAEYRKWGEVIRAANIKLD